MSKEAQRVAPVAAARIPDVVAGTPPLEEIQQIGRDLVASLAVEAETQKGAR